jgi:hypothetical protein
LRVLVECPQQFSATFSFSLLAPFCQLISQRIFKIKQKNTIMKKMMLLCASFLLVGLFAANAQSQDTTKRPTREGEELSQPTQQSNQMTQKKDLVKVQASEIPASLRKTLEDPMYAGWENSTIWKNKTNDQYTIELMTGNTTKTYRFDKSGKPIQDY